MKSLAEQMKSIVQPLIQTMMKEKDDKIEELEKELCNVKQASTNLQDEVDELEQYSRRNNLRIWGGDDLKEQTNENTNALIVKYAEKVGVNITEAAIGRSQRVGNPITTDYCSVYYI